MRRLRLDEIGERGHSGRRLVLAAGLVLLILWGALYLAFIRWRARYRERAAFGVSRVAPVVDAMAGLVPPGVDPAAWRDAVGRTHAMLVSVVSANLLDVPRMEAFRDELAAAVDRARARPETARDELAGIWDLVADRAPFVLEEGTSGRKPGHPRPAILPGRVTPDPPRPGPHPPGPDLPSAP